MTVEQAAPRKIDEKPCIPTCKAVVKTSCYDSKLGLKWKDTRSICEETSVGSMATCFPKCMSVEEDHLVTNCSQSSKLSPNVVTDKVKTNVQAFDLEELGHAAASQVAHNKQGRRIIVDYEDNDGYRPELRNEEAACVSSACGPVLRATSGNGRHLVRRRSRCSSPAIAAIGMASVNNEQTGNLSNSTPTSNFDTDLDEEVRCSKTHKLCMCEVKLHCSLDSCWLVSSGQVYDVTGIVTAHPGGVDSILRKSGGPDCARDMKFHTKNARKIMEKCYIGKLQRCGDDVDRTKETNCTVM